MIVFKNAYLLDGTGSDPVVDAWVAVEDDKIKYVGKDFSVPEEATVIDLHGKPLLPGFMDAHVHIGCSEDPNRPIMLGKYGSYNYAATREAYLKWGVTTLRSAGDYVPDILEFRDEVNAGKLPSPRILAPGKYFQAKNGHPTDTVFFSDPGIVEYATISVDENTDIAEEVRKQAEMGVDHIKVFIQDDNAMKNREACPRLTLEQLQLISETSHQYGKQVMVHVDDAKDLVDAIKMGADTIEHVIQAGAPNHEVSDDMIEEIIKHDIWIVPTTICCKIFDQEGKNYKSLLEVVKRFIKAGVKIGIGSDAGVPMVPYGECVHLEMETMTTLGMTPLEAITAATGGNAAMVKKEDVFGVIQLGKSADIVILGSNPLDDIRNTRDIKMVLCAGKVVVDNLLSR